MFNEQKTNGKTFLFTGMLIQDPLENQFSIYRQKGGYTRNPTVKSFQTTFKINIFANLMKPANTANSATNADEDINILDLEEVGTSSCDLLLKKDAEENELNIVQSSNSDSDSDLSTSTAPLDFEFNLFRKLFEHLFCWIFGQKVLEKFNCVNCQTLLEGFQNLDNNKELLIFL